MHCLSNDALHGVDFDCIPASGENTEISAEYGYFGEGVARIKREDIF